MRFLSKKLLTLLVLYSVAALFFMLTDPTKLPLPVLIIPFIYIFAVIFLSVRYACEFFGLSNRNSAGVAMTLSIFIVLVLVLASIHQLTARDLIISLVTTMLLSWYISRMS